MGKERGAFVGVHVITLLLLGGREIVWARLTDERRYEIRCKKTATTAG